MADRTVRNTLLRSRQPTDTPANFWVGEQQPPREIKWLFDSIEANLGENMPMPEIVDNENTTSNVLLVWHNNAPFGYALLHVDADLEQKQRYTVSVVWHHNPTEGFANKSERLQNVCSEMGLADASTLEAQDGADEAAAYFAGIGDTPNKHCWMVAVSPYKEDDLWECVNKLLPELQKMVAQPTEAEMQELGEHHRALTIERLREQNKISSRLKRMGRRLVNVVRTPRELVVAGVASVGGYGVLRWMNSPAAVHVAAVVGLCVLAVRAWRGTEATFSDEDIGTDSDDEWLSRKRKIKVGAAVYITAWCVATASAAVPAFTVGGFASNAWAFAMIYTAYQGHRKRRRRRQLVEQAVREMDAELFIPDGQKNVAAVGEAEEQQ